VRQAATAEEYTDMSSFVRRTLAARVRELGFYRARPVGAPAEASR
jgi:hypothetical protein